MKESEVVELVNRHADALKDGRDFSRELAAREGNDGKFLGELFGVADRLKAALTPVTPRPAFVRQLKQQLIREARDQQATRQQQVILVVAGLGGVLYAAGMLALGVRASLWMFGLVALWLGWKKRPMAPQRETAR
jgi:hypothetical protein